ncbi:PREDICTED: uncharacterized protein LOC109192678 [Ipomoea nil]|uniref:uncharacterized protein LOC109192678 n=1 Tax=Ipomoea nil TaxID=35883 RepID=UPI00090129E3|nr:PREDICTED: uncharacterized protein LOC109192678 [Ipomoea nil]
MPPIYALLSIAVKCTIAVCIYIEKTRRTGFLGILFDCEEEPGIPKPKDDDDDYDHDDEFAFDFSGQLEKSSFSAADELFDDSKIKPLKPSPRLQYERRPSDSSRSPKQRIKEAFSPCHQRKDFDPFSTALEKVPMKGAIQCFDERERNQSNAFFPPYATSMCTPPTRCPGSIFGRRSATTATPSPSPSAVPRRTSSCAPNSSRDTMKTTGSPKRS